MIFGFGHHILSIFGQQEGTWGPASTGGGTPADQDMEDLYTIRVGIDAGDTQAQMQAFSGNFKNLGQDVSQTSAMIHAGFRRINRYLGLLGINISGMGMARQLIEVDQAVRNLQRGMFDATREAARGGGAMLQWTEMNDATVQQYMRIVVRARESWRRSEQEIVGMFRTVGGSGIAAAANIQISTEDIEAHLLSLGKTSTETSREWAEAQLRMEKSIEDVGKAVTLGFKLEFLGLSAQQVSSLYHSMSVNLRMDMAGIEEALYKVFVTAEMTSFAWQEHVRYIEQALARYSKLGVTIYDVSAFLLTMIERVRTAGGAFDRVGAVYELFMERMGIRQQMDPMQQMRLFQMIRPEQIGDIIGEPGTAARRQFEENLDIGVSQLGPGRGFTTQELLTRRLDPTQYWVAWQAMNEGMMNLTRIYAMQNVMGQLGPRGPEMRPLFAAQFPEWATYERGTRAGVIETYDDLIAAAEAARDSMTTMAELTERAEERLPEERRGAERFWSRVEERMTDVYNLLDGWKKDTKIFMSTLMLQLRSGAYRQAHALEQEASRRQLGVTQRETAAQYMRGEIPFEETAEQVLGEIEPIYLRRFVEERFGKVGTQQERAAAFRSMSQDFAAVMERFVVTTPEGQRAFQPLSFATAGVTERFMGLSLVDFMSFYSILLQQQLPGAEQLPVLPEALRTTLMEAGEAEQQRRATRRRLEAVSPFGTSYGIMQRLGPGGVTYRTWLEELGVPVQAPLLQRSPLDVEEPTSYGVPSVMYPGGGRRTSIDTLKEEGLALGGGTRPGELPVVQLTAHLHMAPGQTITFQDVVTQVEMANARTRNIAGAVPGVG